MPNTYKNKVVVDGVTLIDLTSDTAVAADVAQGKYFHLASGERVAGTASGGSGDVSLRELICPQQTVTPSSYTASLDHVAGLFVGGHYVVTYDGTEYVFSAGNLWGGNSIVVGEQTYYYDHSTRTDEIAPFALYESFNDITRTPKLYAKDNNSHTIKVERIDRDGITTTTICPQQTVTTNSSKIGSLSNTTAQLVVGDYYLVTYDGTEWMVTAAYLWGETTGVGDDQTIWSSTTDDTVYPFFAYNNGQGMGFYAIDANASHTIKIEHIDSIPDALVLTTKTITNNGTYNASSDNATGYSSVTVNVSGGGGSPTLQAKTRTISAAGTFVDTPDSGYDGLSSVTTTVPSASVEDSGVIWSYSTDNNRRKCTMTGWAVFVGGYISGAVEFGGEWFVAIPANTTVTPTTSAQTIGGANYMMEGPVTVEAMPTGTAGTPTATKGSVSNHSVSVTPSVTNTTGYITGGTKTGTAVTVSASELVSGSETKTANGTYDVTNLAELVVDVQGGSTPDVQVATATAYTGANKYVGFMDLAGEPTSFVLISTDDIATSSTPTVAAVAYDGNDLIGQTITNTANAQVSYNDSVFSMDYYNGNFSVGVSDQSDIRFGPIPTSYVLVYTYNGTAGNVQTQDVQVGSGATSITFTGLDDEPEYFSCLFKSNFSTSSGYQRVIGVVYDGTDVYGLEMDSSAKYSDVHWTYSYSSGSLTITSSGTNAGGYFHQPGYYQLTYAVSGDQSLQSKTVTPTEQTQNVTADTGYTALKKVTVNPIPSQYIVPTGNIAITSNTSGSNTLDVSHYATATVNGPTSGSSMNVQTAQSTTRSTSTSGTNVISLTCSKTGTYTVRWSTFRSSTSGTWGSRLYIGGTAHENMQTSGWSNHIQNREVTGVSISANQAVAVYVQSRGNNYYGYVGTLTIIQTA